MKRAFPTPMFYYDIGACSPDNVCLLLLPENEVEALPIVSGCQWDKFVDLTSTLTLSCHQGTQKIICIKQ